MDENVVHINHDFVLHDESVKYCVHHGLERCGAVAHSKEHDGGLKETTMSSKSSFPSVLFFDLDVVIT